MNAKFLEISYLLKLMEYIFKMVWSWWLVVVLIKPYKSYLQYWHPLDYEIIRIFTTGFYSRGF